ncbi:MAG TPA: hypothetical protein PLP33_07195 [Leptospiraceae bacterium]|jgi:hypothetical protein|nr:hypothetical protein [Leptospiraceae bacterium]
MDIINEESDDSVMIENDTAFVFYKKDTVYYHRVNGPAIIWKDGTKEWWINGKRHRTNGPAIIHSGGEEEWWIDNICYIFFGLRELITKSIFLGKEKGKYDIEWLRFLTETKIEEFPVIAATNILNKIERLTFGDFKQYFMMKEFQEKIKG